MVLRTLPIVCANEEVLNDSLAREMGNRNQEEPKQWMHRIPLYAERLLKAETSTAEGVKECNQQDSKSTAVKWISKSIDMTKQTQGYYHRPDTLFGPLSWSLGLSMSL
jgi:leucyl-tRNA synthetase